MHPSFAKGSHISIHSYLLLVYQSLYKPYYAKLGCQCLMVYA